MELNLSRTATEVGVNPLQPANIEAWLNIHGVGGLDDRVRYYDFVTAMDIAFMSYQRKKQEEETSKREEDRLGKR